MIELTYAQLRSPEFDKVMGVLKDAKGLRPKAAYTVGKVIAALQSEFKTAVEMHRNILSEYIKKDEAGNVVMEEGRPALKEGADQKALESKIAEYFDIKFTIPQRKLTLEDLEQITPPLTPAEVMALEPLLETEGTV